MLHIYALHCKDLHDQPVQVWYVSMSSGCDNKTGWVIGLDSSVKVNVLNMHQEIIYFIDFNFCLFLTYIL